MQRIMRTWTFIAGLLTAFLWADWAGARSAVVIGDEGHPWEEAREAPLAELWGEDAMSLPEWLAPRRVDGEELVATVATEGGRWCSTWYSVAGMMEATCNPVEGSIRTYIDLYFLWATSSLWFASLPVRKYMVYLDLGGQFGVSGIQIEPFAEEDLKRNLEGNKFTKAEYVAGHPLLWTEVGVNDGDVRKVDVYGQPVLQPVWGQKVGAGLRVDVSFPARPVRYVGLQVQARWPLFDIGALHVYGEGFVPQTVYRSPVMDLGGVSALGDIRWVGQKDPGADIRMYTRSGSDPTPDVYWRKTEEGTLSRYDPYGVELTRDRYYELFSKQGGITEDTEHWSLWSGAYPFEQGEQGIGIASPSPCRYVQIKVEMQGRYDEDRRLDRMAFEYSQPVLAHRILGEITPVQVQPSERTTFHYAIAPVLEIGDRGFDAVEIFTPGRVDTVRSVRWDGVEIPVEAEERSDPPRLIVHFPRVKRTLLRVDVVFDATVFRYGTTFGGRVWDWKADEVPQWVTPGDASRAIESSTLSVQTRLKGPLLTSVEIHPDLLSPNGDGVNEVTWISYDVLQVTGGAPVRVEILDLSGRRMRTVYAGTDPSGRYQRRWDGRDEGGGLVPPGLYVIRVSVEADAGMESLGRTLSVVY